MNFAVFVVLDSRTGLDCDGLVEYGDFVVEIHRRFTKQPSDAENAQGGARADGDAPGDLAVVGGAAGRGGGGAPFIVRATDTDVVSDVRKS